MELKMVAIFCIALLSLFQAPIAVSAKTSPETADLQKAYFAAGCFWKVQYVFSKTPGVVRTEVGYTGGHTKDPTYRDVCTDLTNHAETCLVVFDATKTTYHKLLETFFANHDPTTLNRQGPDEGTQYRSAIFYATPEQKEEAVKYEQQLQREHHFLTPIVTEIKPLSRFYKAEEYHQDYYLKHGAVCF